MGYDLIDKTIIITGGSSGIGKAAAVQLAKLGASVVLACRSKERGKQAVDEVRQAANSFDVEPMQLDLSSQKSIRQFAIEFSQRYEWLDVLIHNAANFDHTQKEPVFTSDGLETVFATNHLGPFLLTYLLLDMLKASAPSHIITVASKGLLAYPFMDIEFDNLYGERKFNLQHAYYHSKQAQVMFTFDLAERLRGTGISVHCVRVGNVGIPDQRLAHLPRWMLKLYQLKRKFSVKPEKRQKLMSGWLLVPLEKSKLVVIGTLLVFRLKQMKTPITKRLRSVSGLSARFLREYPQRNIFDSKV